MSLLGLIRLREPADQGLRGRVRHWDYHSTHRQTVTLLGDTREVTGLSDTSREVTNRLSDTAREVTNRLRVTGRSLTGSDAKTSEGNLCH